MAAWDYSNSTDIFGSDARRGALVFIPDDSLSANAQGTEAPGRVAHIDCDFRGPNIPPDKAHAADLDVIVAKLRENGL